MRKSYYIASNPLKLAKSLKVVRSVQLDLQRQWINQGTTPREMAYKSGVSISTVYRHRKHEVLNASFRTVMALAGCSGRSLGQILRAYETVQSLTSIDGPGSTQARRVKAKRRQPKTSFPKASLVRAVAAS